MFDLVAKFESKVKVKPFDKDFEKLLDSCQGNTQLPCSVYTLEHNVEIKNSPVIPDEKWIENTRKVISQGLSETMKNADNINAEPMETTFVGFTKISQKQPI